MVDNNIFDHRLPPIAFYVYCYSLRCRNRQHGCYPSRQTIAKACGISGSSVGRAIKQLERKGLIQVKHNFGDGRQRNNSYDPLPLDTPWVHDEPPPPVIEQ